MNMKKMYQLQRMANHEHKNELSIISGLVHKNNKKLKDYIDGLINLKVKNNDQWMEKLKCIPEGGLRGLLYYKMRLMEEKNINVEFDVNRNVTTHLLLSMKDEVKNQLCKIIGIYLDNAIQAVQDLENKNIRIGIYAEKKNSKTFTISIINNYDGTIDLTRINEKGYSTKGKGRGLGLSMAQEILEKVPEIKSTTKIIKRNFMQEIQVYVN